MSNHTVHDGSGRQREYLMGLRYRFKLLHPRKISYREMSRRSDELSERGFTHQAISKWFRGATQPSEEGREFLSVFFKVKRAEIDRACGVLREGYSALRTSPPVYVLREYRLVDRQGCDLGFEPFSSQDDAARFALSKGYEPMKYRKRTG
jgi:hypothetical protein